MRRPTALPIIRPDARLSPLLAPFLAVLLASISALGCDTQQPISQTRSKGRADPTNPTHAPAITPSPGAAQAPSPAETFTAPGNPGESDDVFQRDIQRICHVMKESGANQLTEAEHQYTVAQWLGRNITSEPGRAFLAKLARTPPDGKAALLRATGKQAGLDDCPLATMWDTAALTPPTAN